MEHTTGEQLVKYSKQKFHIIEKTKYFREKLVSKIQSGAFFFYLVPRN